MFIHESASWPIFRWNNDSILLLLEDIYREQGILLGRLMDIGIDNRLKSMTENVTADIVYSSEIEGIKLNVDEVRSSVARHLGMDLKKSVPSSHYVDAVVSVTLDAMQNYDKPLTKEKLCQWQAAFFPVGRSAGIPIETGIYRSHEEHIVSGMFGRERIHYIAPAPERVEEEMDKFINWFNEENPSVPSVIRSGIAHLWFVSIHPFEDGNGRLARILSDIMLAKGEKSKFRFYNLSAEINKDKKKYYEILERTQRSDGDITDWLKWYLHTTHKAIVESKNLISNVLNKSIFWQYAKDKVLNARQQSTLNLFLDGYEAKITSKTWASINKCSKDTAIRDIDYLVKENLLVIDIPNAKRPSYSINFGSGKNNLNHLFADTRIIEDNGIHYLVAVFKNVYPVKERILKLDAERVVNNDIPIEHLLQKYCSYLLDDNLKSEQISLSTEKDISDTKIIKGVSKGKYRIRCCVAGVQQMARELTADDCLLYENLKMNGNEEKINDFKQKIAMKYFKDEIMNHSYKNPTGLKP